MWFWFRKLFTTKVVHVTAIVLLITEINSYISRIFTKVGIQILCNSIVPCHRPIGSRSNYFMWFWFRKLFTTKVVIMNILDEFWYRKECNSNFGKYPKDCKIQYFWKSNHTYSKSKSHEIIRPWANEVMVIGGSWWYITLSDTPINQISWV
jgi:hypothetical protein